jgi:signal transduction histidine kinase
MLMPSTPEDTLPPVYGPGDQLRHDLKSSLTTIHGHAQLLGRAIRRSPSLADNERGQMLEGVTTIEGAVREMVALIDAMGREGSRPTDSGADPPV